MLLCHGFGVVRRGRFAVGLRLCDPHLVRVSDFLCVCFLSAFCACFVFCRVFLVLCRLCIYRARLMLGFVGAEPKISNLGRRKRERVSVPEFLQRIGMNEIWIGMNRIWMTKRVWDWIRL